MHWYAITYLDRPDQNPDRRVGPFLVRAAGFPGKVFWGWGPTHFYMSADQKPEIVKDYGRYIQNGRGHFKQFVKDFPPVVTDENSLCEGWLSPKGELYAFGYGEHSPMAERLFIVYGYRGYVPYNDYERALLKRGWINIRMHMKFVSMDEHKKPTQEQIDRLQKITDAHPDSEDWKRALRYIAHYDR